ncbi:hypothetical protein GGF31_002423 [Allomyces arbusculus]|nr:hypothetical protein GGF31_002423 [Allomyces arbusculus]
MGTVGTMTNPPTMASGVPPAPATTTTNAPPASSSTAMTALPLSGSSVAFPASFLKARSLTKTISNDWRLAAEAYQPPANIDDHIQSVTLLLNFAAASDLSINDTQKKASLCYTCPRLYWPVLMGLAEWSYGTYCEFALCVWREMCSAGMAFTTVNDLLTLSMDRANGCHMARTLALCFETLAAWIEGLSDDYKAGMLYNLANAWTQLEVDHGLRMLKKTGPATYHDVYTTMKNLSGESSIRERMAEINANLGLMQGHARAGPAPVATTVPAAVHVPPTRVPGAPQATQASIDRLTTTMENLIIVVAARPADGPRPLLAATVGAHPHVPYLMPHAQCSVPHAPYLTLHASHPMPHALHLTPHTSHLTPRAPHSAPHAPYSAQQVPHPAPCTPAYSPYSSAHGPHLLGHTLYLAPPVSYAPSVGVYAQAAEPLLMPPYHGLPPRPPRWRDLDPVQYREFVCFYCDGTGHHMVQCDYLLEDMRAG